MLKIHNEITGKIIVNDTITKEFPSRVNFQDLPRGKAPHAMLYI